MHDWGWFGMGGMVLFWVAVAVVVAVVLVIALRSGGGVAAAAGPVDLAAGSRTQGKLGTRYGQMAACSRTGSSDS